MDATTMVAVITQQSQSDQANLVQLSLQERHCKKANGIVSVSPSLVYNLPLFEGYLVIDTREPKEFMQDKIATSLNFPPSICATLPLEHFEVFFLEKIQELTPEHYSPIVLYDGCSQGMTEHTKWLANRLLNFKSNFAVPKGLKYLHQRFESNQKVWVIEGGFEAFKKEFPMLCGAVNFGEMQSLPFQIAPGLFLGCRATESLERREEGRLGLDRELLHAFKIDYVIVNASMPLLPEDTLGLHCLTCAVADSNNVQMGDIWCGAVAFIENARKSGGKILVQLHGRSRSASVMVAWAMAVLKFPFEDALSFIMEKCPYRLDTSLMYIQQLKCWTFVSDNKLPSTIPTKMLKN